MHMNPLLWETCGERMRHFTWHADMVRKFIAVCLASASVTVCLSRFSRYSLTPRVFASLPFDTSSTHERTIENCNSHAKEVSPVLWKEFGISFILFLCYSHSIDQLWRTLCKRFRFAGEINVDVTNIYFFPTGFWYFRSLVSGRSRRGSCRGHCRVCIRNGTFHAIVCAQSPIAFRLYVLCIVFFPASAPVVVCLLRFSRCPLTLNEGA